MTTRIDESGRTGRELLDPKRLARLNRLKLGMGQIVEGVLTGRHKSPHRGSSVEFAEHKVYTPGDDIRHIDWRAYARTDRYMVKHFEAETNLAAYMVVDGSASMGYGRGELTKFEAAQRLAASLTYLLLKQQDAAGLVISGGEDAGAGAGATRRAPEVLHARSGLHHLQAVLTTLARFEPSGDRPVTEALTMATEQLSRRGFVAVFSDLFAPEAEVLGMLRQLRRRKHRVAVFHLLDRDELEFPFEDPARFVDIEDEKATLPVSPSQVREAYLDAMGSFIGRCRSNLRAADVDYILCDTSEPLEAPLLRFLRFTQG